MQSARHLLNNGIVLATGLGLALLCGCPAKQDAPQRTAAESSAAVPPVVESSPSQVASGPPPERFSTLPPGAFESEAGTTEDAAVPSDPGLTPNAGSYDLTGVRLGMTSAEVYGRYSGESGWEYDTEYSPGTETGVLLAKPRDARARASEMFYMLDGVVVAFLRAVQEDKAAFDATSAGLARQYGSGQAAPPEWARDSGLLRSWRSTPNETSQFWGEPRKRHVLTAGHSPTGRETVYMLLDIDRVQAVHAQVQQSSQQNQTAPETAPNQHTGSQ